MKTDTTILLVDDESEILRGTTMWMTAAGHETITACNGADAVVAAAYSQPDAIVMDVRMPVEDGLSALARMQHCEQARGIPVIMLSASLVDKERALDAGARYFLTKPYQGRDLVDVIDAVINPESDVSQPTCDDTNLPYICHDPSAKHPEVTR